MIKCFNADSTIWLEYIQKLKKICDVAEWEDFRERLLTSPNTYSVKYDFLKEEGLFERLLLEIENSISVYALDQYEAVLKNIFLRKSGICLSGMCKKKKCDDG